MVPPSMNHLMKASDSKYAIVVAVARRARQLSEVHKKDENWRLSGMVSLALDELSQGKLRIVEKGQQ
ncbi:MAG: DNA-directed RNA polymerase subunit omega [Syntrophomonadaceae bacterium]|nr:DNA-directed RNA polymerase subunit omega [Syntrophomonadaceae bacterium]